MYTKYSYLALLASLLCACATSTENNTVVDGIRVNSIDCSGQYETWGRCYQIAGELCGTKGYKILQKDEDQAVAVTGSSNSPGPSRSMIIQCKE